MPIPCQARDKLQWASIVEQKRNIWILAESSIYDSTNRRFVERPYGRRLDSSRSIDPWGVFDPLEFNPCLTRGGNDKLSQHPCVVSLDKKC